MKVVAIVQARMNSNRLPGKIIQKLPFISGTPIINIILGNLNKMKFINKVILATSVNKENEILNKIVPKNTTIFRGSEDNVLERFYKVAKKQNADLIIRFTGDNPIQCPKYIKETLDFHVENNFDYTKTVGLPLGTNIEIFSFYALENAYNNATTSNEKEHVTPYILNSSKFNKGVKKINLNKEVGNLRLTIDYPSDFAMMNLLFSANDKINNLNDVFNILEQNNWIKEVNLNNKQLS